MSLNKFPAGWNEDRVEQLLKYYEGQSEDEVLAEDEAAFAESATVVSIPRDLLPQVRELIAKYQR